MLHCACLIDLPRAVSIMKVAIHLQLSGAQVRNLVKHVIRREQLCSLPALTESCRNVVYFKCNERYMLCPEACFSFLCSQGQQGQQSQQVYSWWLWAAKRMEGELPALSREFFSLSFEREAVA